MREEDFDAFYASTVHRLSGQLYGDTYESFAGYAEMLVLDGNVVTLFPLYPAISDEMRTEHIGTATADWRDVVRPQYEPVLR